MSDLGLLSRVHANFEDFADLVDDALAEIQAGRTAGPAAKRLRALLEEATVSSEGAPTLRAMVFSNILASPSGVPVDDFADLARNLANPDAVSTVRKRLGRLSAYLEEERAALAHRLRR
ncbi:hypothetical protein AAAK29_20555 [Mesorhizobium sp. CCNWLW179-1]|uniref:hypothetical protein n=1 Tax=unclassified Mesorhizobium TaxID=325217 RepID=UPI003014C8D5